MLESRSHKLYPDTDDVIDVSENILNSCSYYNSLFHV